MTQDEWPERLAHVVAGEIRRYRLARQPKMSTQGLADACAELGFPMKRSVLANLESGRRSTVSVAELVVIAKVLEVPPILLLYPVGRVDSVELLPGASVDAWAAARWFAGEYPLVGTRTENLRQRPVEWFRQHDELSIDIIGNRHAAGDAFRTTDNITTDSARKSAQAQAAFYADAARDGEQKLRTLRDQMREAGLTPPELRRGLEKLERQQEDVGEQ